MLFALATAILIQNPRSPNVALPPDWKVEYFRNGDARDAALIGPHGEEIRFPPYGEGVEAASKVHARDPEATYVKAFLGGRPIEAALTKKGELTVSTDWRKPHEHASDAPIGFFTKVKDARQTAVALGIVLTYLRAADRDPVRSQLPKRSPDAPAPKTLVSGGPFPVEVCLPEGYRFRRIERINEPIDTFQSPSGPSLWMGRVMSVRLGAQPMELPEAKGWQESASILDGELKVRSDDGAGITAWFDPPVQTNLRGSAVGFTANEETPRAVVVAVFAALSYVPNRPLPRL